MEGNFQAGVSEHPAHRLIARTNCDLTSADLCRVVRGSAGLRQMLDEHVRLHSGRGLIATAAHTLYQTN